MVAPRPYRMRARAAAVALTRQAVLAAARELFEGDGFAQVSLDDVADAAEVSRGTVYHHFGSRSGLIEALTTATDDAAGYPQLIEISRQDDPAAALHDTIVEAVGFIHRTRPLFDHLRTLAHLEPDTRQMVERKDAARRTLIADLVRRAADADLLHDTVTAAHATALLTAVTAYDAIRELLDICPSVEDAQQVMGGTVGRLLRTAPA
jgi:AcrR family transcriptional regulator